MKFSLIIPVYNEAPVIVATLRTLIEAFSADASSTWQIVVVDNASTDETARRVKEINDPSVELVHLNEKGKGLALRAGFARADGEVIGFTDADLSVSPEEIMLGFVRAQESHGSVVIGSRYHKDSSTPNREWWRTFSSRMFNLLARTIVGTHVSDTQCPLKVMSGRPINVFLGTKENTWFLDLEFLALCERLAIPVTELPVVWNEHRYPDRRSHLGVFDVFRAIMAMFTIRKRLPGQLALLSSRQQN